MCEWVASDGLLIGYVNRIVSLMRAHYEKEIRTVNISFA